MSGSLTPKPRSPYLLEALKTYRIDINQGRVFSPKGHEFVTGDHDGRVRCSISCWKFNYQTYSVFRYHIIWWKATGEWPTQLIDHKDEIPYHDWFDNLQYLSQSENISKHFATKRKLG